MTEPRTPAYANPAGVRWLPGALLAVASAAAALEAWRLGLGSASHPGAGFFPFWLSAGLGVCALLLASGAGREAATRASTEKAGSLALPLQSFLTLSLYSALLIPLGFIPATFCFFILEMRIVERVAWQRAILLAAVTTAAAYGLFALLDVQLPAGFWFE